MQRTQLEFQSEIKPTEKQAVPRKVSLSCCVVISNDKNKPRGSGHSVLPKTTDYQVFAFIELSKMIFALVKANKRGQPCSTNTSKRVCMLLLRELQKDN